MPNYFLWSNFFKEKIDKYPFKISDQKYAFESGFVIL